jgi:hypothetical protein
MQNSRDSVSLLFSVPVLLYPTCHTKVYPEVSGLAAWSENCEWYSSLPPGAVYYYFVDQSSEFCRHNALCCFSTSVYYCKHTFRYQLSPETFGYTLLYSSVQTFRLRGVQLLGSATWD